MEMIVALGIVAVITVLSLAQYGDAEEGFKTQSAVTDIALAIRESQVYGITVRDTLGAGPDPFEAAHGIRFDEGSNTEFYQFRDTITQNGRWESGEAQRTRMLDEGFTIADICTANSIGGGYNCSPTELAITFWRPIPHAVFNVGNDGTLETSVMQICVEIVNSSGESNAVEVWRTGVIQTIDQCT